MSNPIYTTADVQVAPYQFQRVLSIHLIKQLNEHVSFCIRGIVSEDKLDRYVEKADEDEHIEIFLKSEGKEIRFFQGIVTNIAVKAVNGVRELTIEASSETLMMDIRSKRRSFQKTAESYNNLFSYVTSSYTNAEVIDEASRGAAIGELLVQYNETDWAFIKRIASRLHAALIPITMQQGLKYVIGVPHSSAPQPLNEHNYSIKKDLKEHKLMSRNGLPEYGESNSLSYEVTSNKILELGSSVIFHKRTLYIARAETVTEGNLIVNRYILRDAHGLKCPTVYAYDLSGASLFGKVIDISKEKVKIKLEIDQGSTASGAMWFPYSTVYSSPDGSGWYVMPEVGDQIRLYFPDEREQHAFAASSVDLASSDPVKRSDPAVKSISTKYGKQVVFKPGAVEIINSGQMLMRLTDEGGIEINSNKKITLSAQEDIQITGGTKIIMEGKEGVSFIQSGAKLDIMDDVRLTGGKVNIE
ncbi:phage baseplate assembly protein V [Paenibacillus sp. CMAA1739]|uniref:contractile injection system protein, VgrG/Pvc8 family n=1 Tax=Paenibacillus ottowii TaxID=2315729 RepID=UPI00272F6DA8|nr:MULTISPECIES: contractile injection system protein, VgrG/Pvc8 family [Paenibacillus]MDP1512474.1 phage baseplate assembly protein V [Paenibacillus ottowii]MEC4564432.1 phage baseplate assembly protein V [Paenibacillus sp. CMAA1739]